MSTYASAILFSKLSFNVLSRLATQPWLRRNVRCFSQNTPGVSGLPVKYVPKNRRDINQLQAITPVDITPKEKNVPTRSSSSVFRHKCSEPSKIVPENNNEGKLLNASLDAIQELISEEEYGRDATDNGVPKPVGVECVNAVDITPKDSGYIGSSSSVFRRKSFERLKSVHDESNEDMRWKSASFYTKQELNQEDGYGKKDSEVDKIPQEFVEYVEVAERGTHNLLVSKQGGLSQSLELNEHMSYDGVVDEEHMEVADKVDGEIQPYNRSGRGITDRRTNEAAEKLAIELLAKRAFTVVELQKKLSAKHFPVNIVEAVVHDLQHRGLINDGLYAETFSNSRWKSSSWGPRRIKQALARKGVSELHVEKAVKLVFEDPKECDQRSGITLSSSSLQQLYMQASKQWQRSRNVPHETRKARVIRWLQYRGFDWGVIGTIIKKLESEHPS